MRKLSPYNKFVKRFRKKGFSMSKIADLWRKSGKGKFKSKLPKTKINKSSNRRTTMAKRKTVRRRRGGSMYSNSKANIAMGGVLAAAAPRFAGGAMPYVALLGLVPRMPSAVKIMATTWAAKTISDQYITGGSNNG